VKGTYLSRPFFTVVIPTYKQKKKDRLKFLSKIEWPLDSRLILFVGRLEGAKDPILLIETFYHIHKLDPMLKLIIVGTGSLKNRMLRLTKDYRLMEHVLFLGILSHKEVSNIMGICDVFLLTSAFEGMPRSVLESLASGLPVVSTNVGEVKRVIKDGYSGFISPIREPKIIGNLVLKLLNNKTKFNTGNCLNSIKDYTSGKILKKIYKIYFGFGSQVIKK